MASWGRNSGILPLGCPRESLDLRTVSLGSPMSVPEAGRGAVVGRGPNSCFQPGSLLPLPRAWKGVGTRREWGPPQLPTSFHCAHCPPAGSQMRLSPTPLLLGPGLWPPLAPRQGCEQGALTSLCWQSLCPVCPLDWGPGPKHKMQGEHLL